MWSVARIQGEILDQLIFWITIVGLLTLSCLAAALGSVLAGVSGAARARVPIMLTAGATWLVVAATAANGVNHLYLAHARAFGEPAAQRVKAASADLAAYLGREGLHRPFLRIAQPTWGDATGIVLALTNAGVPVAIEPDWIFMYGAQHAATGEEDCEVVLADAKRRASLEHRRPVRAGRRVAGTLHLRGSARAEGRFERLALDAGDERPDPRDVHLLDRDRLRARPARGTPAGRGRT